MNNAEFCCCLVWLLLLQVIAFCLYSAPLYYMSEKLLGVHTRSMPLKLMARLPVCEYQGIMVLQPQQLCALCLWMHWSRTCWSLCPAATALLLFCNHLQGLGYQASSA
jgi:hypothetical protein